MPIRKSEDIASESDGRYSNITGARSRAKITRRFDSSTHNPYPGDEALQFLNLKLDDIIDEANALRTASGSFSTRATTNDAKTGITSGQASAITANTAKTGIIASQADAILSVGDVEGATGITAIASGDAEAGYNLTFTLTIDGADSPLTAVLALR